MTHSFAQTAFLWKIDFRQVFSAAIRGNCDYAQIKRRKGSKAETYCGHSRNRMKIFAEAKHLIARHLVFKTNRDLLAHHTDSQFIFVGFVTRKIVSKQLRAIIDNWFRA